MHAQLTFIIWWLITLLIALPFETIYLASNLKKLSVVSRIVYKIVPIFILVLSLLISIAAGVGQRTPYSGFITGILTAYLVGDLCLALGDVSSEFKSKRDAYLWRFFGVLAFAAGHILLIVALSMSPSLSAGMDDGPSAPVFLLLIVPFALLCLLVLAFLVYLRKLTSVEIIVITLYGFILGSVCWRAAARIGSDLDHEYLWAQILSLVAMLIFSVSDFCILIETYLCHHDWSKLWIMSTYWVAVSMLSLSSFLFKTTTTTTSP